jgi:hypothetical protein
MKRKTEDGNVVLSYEEYENYLRLKKAVYEVLSRKEDLDKRWNWFLQE